MYSNDSKSEIFHAVNTSYKDGVQTVSGLHNLAKEHLHWTNHNGFEVPGNIYRIYSQGFIRMETIDKDQPQSNNNTVVNLLSALSTAGIRK